MAQFEAAPMAVRRLILGGDSYGDLPPRQLSRWPGGPATFPVLFNPKLRTNLFLKSRGWPSDNLYAHFARADSRAYLLRMQQRAVSGTPRFNQFADMRGIPAVYVPTSPANNYGGQTG